MNIRKLIFTVRVTEHLHGYPRDAVDSQNPQMVLRFSKSILAMVALGGPAWADQMTFRCLFQPQPLCHFVNSKSQESAMFLLLMLCLNEYPNTCLEKVLVTQVFKQHTV